MAPEERLGQTPNLNLREYPRPRINGSSTKNNTNNNNNKNNNNNNNNNNKTF